ncbi:MAG: hypothetical protein JWN14_4229, partial [Chthonomonadales bacterium]|nr:hypothetical protein [Chthonomonadales bacterium]
MRTPPRPPISFSTIVTVAGGICTIVTFAYFFYDRNASKPLSIEQRYRHAQQSYNERQRSQAEDEV